MKRLRRVTLRLFGQVQIKVINELMRKSKLSQVEGTHTHIHSHTKKKKKRQEKFNTST